MEKFVIFMSLRILDLFSTYLNMAKYGGWEGVEGNPLAAFLIGYFGFSPFVFINLLASMVIFFIIRKRGIIYFPLVAIMAMVVLVNFAVYIFI